jgi:hypothetical protein
MLSKMDTADAKEADDAVESDLHGLNTKAVEALRNVLTLAESDDVKRKAAVDILNFSQIGKSKGRAPQVTEEQLEFLGRVIVEASAVRESLALSKRSLEGPAASSTI